jgi:NADH-quinone oxidoreductase subunit M
MNMDQTSSFPVLTALTFWPVLSAILLAPLRSELAVRRATLAASLIEIALAVPLLCFKSQAGFQFLEIARWAPEWGLTYAMGADGISILMIVLSVLTLPLCVLCSWTYIGRRVKEFHVCLLLMTTACVGVFSALDLVLFYVFWEALLIPMYLMIAIWGGDERRYASIKFFLYTLAGSTLLLAAIVALRLEGGTFSILELMNCQFSFNFQYWVFLAFFLAFAIKVPMFPFHTWLPAAHVQAPSAGSVILAAVLLKMGTYGFLRFSLPITPAASLHFAPMMIAISAASILYGGAIALGQKDIKKLIAYSSVAHMGFVTLGIFLFSVQGLQGAIFQMLNHGIITGAMFMLIGAVYERSHSREIAKNLGLGRYLPCFMFFWGLFGLASFGFPGTNGFVGEFLVLAAAFRSNLVLGLIIVPGALLAAAYILKVTLRMAWGQPASPAGKNWPDLKKKEWAYLIAPAFLVIYLGLAPTGLLAVITPSINAALENFESRRDLVRASDIVVEDLAAGPDGRVSPVRETAVLSEVSLDELVQLRLVLWRGLPPDGPPAAPVPPVLMAIPPALIKPLPAPDAAPEAAAPEAAAPETAPAASSVPASPEADAEDIPEDIIQIRSCSRLSSSGETYQVLAFCRVFYAPVLPESAAAWTACLAEAPDDADNADKTAAPADSPAPAASPAAPSAPAEAPAAPASEAELEQLARGVLSAQELLLTLSPAEEAGLPACRGIRPADSSSRYEYILCRLPGPGRKPYDELMVRDLAGQILNPLAPKPDQEIPRE